MAPGSRRRASGARRAAGRAGSALSREAREPEARSPEPEWADLVLVGRITRAHGLRGDVVISPETDFVDDRFRIGAVLETQGAAGRERLTVRAVRVHSGRPIVSFEGFASIDDAERLAGQELRVPEEALHPLEAGHFYHHQLVGCVVEATGGERVGVVEHVEGGIGGSRLVVSGERGEVLVPLAADICVEIDPGGRRIRIDPPEGLLELNEVRHRDDFPADDRRGARRGGRRTGG